MNERDRNEVAGRDDAKVRSLLESAGRRPPIPDSDLQLIRAAGREAWEARLVGETSARRRSGGLPHWALALAASLAIALGAAGWWLLRAPAAPQIVAHLDSVNGQLEVVRPDREARVLAGSGPLTLGSRLASGASPASAAVRLAGGVALRLDADTRLELLGGDEVRLEGGALYVDTGYDGSAPRGPVLRIHTPRGTVQDIGTRFIVRVEGEETPTVSVRVRDGAIAVNQGSERRVARAGEELTIGEENAERQEIAVYGPGWEWVLAAAPRFEMDGRPLGELLDWVQRETGWQIVFESEELAKAARKIPLHGSMGNHHPDEAPFVFLPSAGLSGRLEGDALIISRS